MILLECEIEALEKYRIYRMEKLKLMGINHNRRTIANYEELINDLLWDLAGGDYAERMDGLIKNWREKDAEIYQKQ